MKFGFAKQWWWCTNTNYYCFTWNLTIWIDLLEQHPSILCFISPGIISPGTSLRIFLLRKIQVKKKYHLLSIFMSAEGTISCKLLKTLLRNDWPNQQMMQQNHFSSNKYNRFKFYIFILIKIKPSPHLLSPCCSDVPNI